MARADRFVVGVEQEPILGIEGAIRGDEFLEDEFLEKPGGVGQMPFGRTGIGHRLDRGIGVRERLGQLHAAGATGDPSRKQLSCLLGGKWALFRI
jgi:hypothetical protein